MFKKYWSYLKQNQFLSYIVLCKEQLDSVPLWTLMHGFQDRYEYEFIAKQALNAENNFCNLLL